MPQLYADVVAAEVEAVTPLLTGFFDMEGGLYTEFDKVQVINQSGRNNRMPIMLRPGGKALAVDLNNGSLGAGGGPTFDFTAMSPVDFSYNIAWSLKVKYTTDSDKKAVVNVVQKTIAEGVKEARLRIDKYLQTAGTGILATIASGGGSTTWTCNTGSFKNRLVRFGDQVSAYAANQLTLRGQANVTGIDYQAGTITVDADPGTSNTDVVCVGGLTALPPVWIYGLPYNHNNSNSGTFLGWNRANYPEVRTPTVNANSAQLTPDLLNQLLVLIDGELGEDVFDTGKWFWYTHPKQHYALVQFMTMISEISLPMGGSGNGQVDLGHTRRKNRVFGGIRIKTSINAAQDRVDLIDGSNWVRAVYKEIGWETFSDGKTVRPVPGTNTYLAQEISYMTCSHQFAIKNPRRGGYISSLLVPV